MSPQPYWHDPASGALCTALPGTQPWCLVPVRCLHEPEEQALVDGICRSVREGWAVWRDGPPEVDENGRMIGEMEYPEYDS